MRLSASSAPTVDARALAAVRWLSLAALAYALVVCAWQCDDAYITFRTTRNFWEGRGLTWNPGERVQGYTHPLWFAASLVMYGLTRELYFSMTALSIALTLMAAGLLLRHGAEPLRAVACVLVMVASRAIVDYSVSGLENPLLNCLLVCFMLAASRPSGSWRRELCMGLSISGVFLTRADAVLLVAPLGCYLGASRSSATRWLVFGLAPILLWELFSLVYYGSLVPNTAYAKLNLALPGAVRWLSGVLYTLDSALYDPVTLSAMLLAAAFAASRCSTWGVLASVGALLYWLYVASIGGDFMSGRFFGAPLMFALCAACLGRPMVVPSSPRLAYTCAVLAAYALAWPSSPLRGTADFGQDYQHARKIADERAFYYRVTGLLPVLKRRAQLVAAGLPVPAPRNAVEGRAFAAGSRPIAVMGDVGFFGYHAGDKPIVDVYALTDPFLARIAYAPHGDFRVGHYARPLPDGYLESRVAGDNRITDVSLHEAYAAIRLVVSGPLLSPERWRAIWQLQTGHFARAFQSDASTGADAR